MNSVAHAYEVVNFGTHLRLAASIETSTGSILKAAALMHKNLKHPSLPSQDLGGTPLSQRNS